MAQYMKKNRLGCLISTEDINDSGITEIRLTPDEYDYLWDRIQKAEQKLEQLGKEMEGRVSEAYQKADKMLSSYKKRIKEEAEKRMMAAYKSQRTAEEWAEKSKLKEQEAILERNNMERRLEEQLALNNNLKRVCRERANAKRGITPKKERQGYQVIVSTEYKEKYRDKNKTQRTADTWKTTIQTPYDASIPLDLIEDEIWEDLLSSVLFQIGVRQVQEINGQYRIWTEKDEKGADEEVCGLYRWSFKANYRIGLWEIVLYSTKSLSVPAEYRP